MDRPPHSLDDDDKSMTRHVFTNSCELETVGTLELQCTVPIGAWGSSCRVLVVEKGELPAHHKRRDGMNCS
jgi:hypothetical protein